MDQREREREQCRQQYLAAMGVTSWLPVDALPGAAPSPQWVWESEQPGSIDQQAVSGPSPESQATAANQASLSGSPATLPVTSPVAADTPRAGAADAKRTTAALQQMLSSESSSSAAKSRSVEPIVPETPAVNSAPAEQLSNNSPIPESELPIPKGDIVAEEPVVPRFRVAVLAYEDCLVVNELPLDVLQGMTTKHQQLLQRILGSIALGKGSPKVQLLAWPVV
ncbi:MAG: hypothetical protein OQK12_04675, partial [Motiliproteus sp.]|nr:hypothetical protein [Motiliproteus sp.]